MKRIFLIYIGVMCCVSLCMAQSYDESTGLRLFKEESYSQALPYLQRAAKSGSLVALDCLGQMYQYGWGVEKNETIMLNMYNRAVQQSYVPSIMNLAFYYYFSNIPKKSYELWQKAADLGSGEGWKWVGFSYELGMIGDKNLDKALDAYSKAIDCGTLNAYNDLGRICEELDLRKLAYDFYMKAYENSILDNNGLIGLVTILCDRKTLYYSQDYDKNVVKAGEILNSVQDNLDKVNELKEKYKDVLELSSRNVMYAQQRKQLYYALTGSSYTPKIEFPEVEMLPSGGSLTYISIPARQKKIVDTKGLFGDDFTISFFLKSTDIGAAGGTLFYGFTNYSGADINKQDYPVLSIVNGQLTFRYGKESYQSCTFKQFKDAKEVIYNGVWHHIVLTFSIKNKKAEIYVDDNWKGNEYVSESNSLKKMCLVFCAGSQDLKIGNLRLFKNKVLDRMEISVLYSNEYK